MTTIGTGTVTRVPYTVASAIASRSTEVLTMPDVLPIVFVVDDDLSVRESLELLIKSAGWQPETFVSAQEFLSRPQSPVPCCLVLDVTLPGLSGLEFAEAACRADGYADHLHHRTRRRADDRASDESWSRRVLDEAI